MSQLENLDNPALSITSAGSECHSPLASAKLNDMRQLNGNSSDSTSGAGAKQCLPAVQLTDLATSRQNYIRDNAVNMYNQFGSPQDFNKLLAPGNTEVSRQQLDGIVKESERGNSADWTPAQMAAIRFMRDEYNRDISQHHHLNVQTLDQYAVRNGALDTTGAPLHVASEESIFKHDNAANMWKQFGNEQAFGALAGPGNNEISRQQLERMIKSPDFEQKWTPEQKSAIQFMNDHYNKNISQHHRLRLDTMAAYAAEQGVDLREGPDWKKRPLKPETDAELHAKNSAQGNSEKSLASGDLAPTLNKLQQDEERLKKDQRSLKDDIEADQKLLDARHKDDKRMEDEINKAKKLIDPSSVNDKMARHPDHSANAATHADKPRQHTHHAISTKESVAQIAARELQNRKEQDIESYGKKHNLSEQDAAAAWQKAWKQNLLYEEHLIRLYNHIKPSQTNKVQRQARTILLD